jgi:Flp pilus assembly protein TadG
MMEDTDNTGEHLINLPSSRKSRAQAMVELAFVMPILILLIIGALDVGRLFYDDIIVGNAVREGVRRAIDSSYTDSQIQTFVQNAAPGLTLTGITVIPSPRTVSDTSTITVRATYSMTVFTPGISSIIGSPKAVVHEAYMRSLN